MHIDGLPELISEGIAMPNKYTAAVFLLIACFVGYVVWGSSRSDTEFVHQETTYDRVIKSGKLRCGYVVYPPSTIKDPNTGAITGFSADIINKLASDLGLKVEWTEETGSATTPEALKSDRFDMLCTSIWTSSTRGKVELFTMPIYYTIINAYARKEDGRFVDNEKSFDDPSVRISTVDGDIAGTIAKEDAPHATLYSLPDLTDFSELLNALKYNKADITFAETMQAERFDKNNPGVIRNITPDKPVRVFASAYAMKLGEDQFASMIDNALRNLVNSGFVEQTINKYTFPGAQKMIARPYQ
ncbi:MAG: transporter substrate-binding domain-containing protein [Alphaproteobacteria bacterium]|nr:transporter substrate-binding domain-containing protein [Alphaproteobacteria bacterium]